MNHYVAFLVAVLLPLGSWAQTDLGLDLTDDGPKKEQPAKKEATPAQPKPSVTKPAPSDDAPVAQPEKDEQAEREVILEDRVKAVQKKVYLKKNRFELSPFVGLSVNDPFYTKYQLTGMIAYYLADTLAIGARFSWISVSRNFDTRIAQHTFDSIIYWADPNWAAMGDVIWSPIYGKATIFNTILHFDAYLIGGMGTVYTDTSVQNGPDVAFDLGVGMKFVAKDYMAINVALIDTNYVDIPTGTKQAVTQNLMTLNVGVSLFVPFKSTGRESE